MRILSIIVAIVSLFITGFAVGSGKMPVLPFSIAAFIVSAYPTIRKALHGISPAFAIKDKSADIGDKPPEFVLEEIEQGVAEISTKALTPEYKKAVRESIEIQIIETLGTLLSLVRQQVPSSFAGFFRRSGNDVIRLFIFDSEQEDILLGAAVKKGEGLVGQVLKEDGGKIVVEGDIRTPSNTLMYYGKDKGVRSLAALPMTVGGICRGALVVDSVQAGAFSEEHMRILESFAHIASAFQYYAYLQLENHIDRDKVTALSVLQRAFFKCETEDRVLSLLGEILGKVTQADRITVSLSEEGSKGTALVRFVQGVDEGSFKGYRFSVRENGLVGLVYQKNDVIQRSFEKGKYVSRFNSKEKPSDKLLSILAVPIFSGSEDECIGVITIESSVIHRFSRIDVESVINLANATGLAIEKVKLLAAQTHLATIDGLTGLPNHREFQNALERSIKRVRRQNGELGLILCDIDHFKSVNDTHGHPAGDAILKGVADVLRNSIRKDVDFVARYGGEEFACVVESGLDMALETAERMRGAVERTPFVIVGGKQLSVTMSFGVAVFPADAQDKKALTEKADKALYASKKGGRNQVRKFQ